MRSHLAGGDGVLTRSCSVGYPCRLDRYLSGQLVEETSTTQSVPEVISAGRTEQPVPGPEGGGSGPLHPLPLQAEGASIEGQQSAWKVNSCS